VLAWWPIFAVLALQLVFLLPVLSSDYVGDDQLNSVFWGGVHTEGVSFWDLATRFSSGFWRTAGRFFPVSFYQGYGLFYVVHGLVAYKAIQIALTLIASLSVAVLLRSLGLSIARTAAVLLVATVAFQLRIGNDAIMAYTGLMQSVVIETALSLACLQRFLRTGSRVALAGSVALFALVCLTYESAYPLVAFHVLLALYARWPQWRRALLTVAPQIAIAVAFIAIASYGRAHAPLGRSGPYAVNFDPGVALKTLGEQLFAGLPLSYVAKAPGDLPFLPHRDLVTAMSPAALLVGVVIAGGALLLRARDRPVPAAAGWRPLTPVAGMVGGLLLWLAAAGPIALAHRYQVELRWGNGHLPVFIEYYGVALMLVSGAVWVLDRRALAPGPRTALAVAAAATLGLAAAVTYGANVKVVDSMHAGRDTRRLFERSLQAGLLDAVPDGANVQDGGAPASWVLVAFYYQHAKRRFAPIAKAPADWLAGTKEHRAPCGPDPAGGWYWVAPVSIAPDGPDRETVTCLGPPGAARGGRYSDRLFLRRMPDDRPFLVTGQYAVDRRGPTGFAKLSTELALRRKGDRAALVVLPRSDLPLNPYLLSVIYDPDRLTPIWGAGCEQAPGAPTVHCGRRGEVALVNPGQRPVRLTLRFTVFTRTPGARFTLGGRAHRIGPQPRPVSATVTLAPGTTRTLVMHGPRAGVVLDRLGVVPAG
jgi:hypothetical protein